MSEKHRSSPETVKPQTLAELVRSAQTVLNHLGEQKSEHIKGFEKEEWQTVDLTIDNSALIKVPEGISPAIEINRPLNNFAREARWAYEIVYGAQNPASSRHILVLNGEIPEAEMTFYDDRPTHPLTEHEAEAVITDLHQLIEPSTA